LRQDQEFFVDGSLVEVLTTQPIDRLFTYRAPREGCFKGAIVLVPFGKRIVVGLVCGASTEKIELKKINTIDRVLDFQHLQQEFQDFIWKVEDYTVSPLYSVFRFATRVRNR